MFKYCIFTLCLIVRPNGKERKRWKRVWEKIKLKKKSNFFILSGMRGKKNERERNIKFSLHLFDLVEIKKKKIILSFKRQKHH